MPRARQMARLKGGYCAIAPPTPTFLRIGSRTDLLAADRRRAGDLTEQGRHVCCERRKMLINHDVHKTSPPGPLQPRGFEVLGDPWRGVRHRLGAFRFLKFPAPVSAPTRSSGLLAPARRAKCLNR